MNDTDPTNTSRSATMETASTAFQLGRWSETAKRLLTRGIPGFWKNYWRGSPRAALVALFFVASALVLLDSLCPLYLHWDMGEALHTAHRWVAGKGLSSANASFSSDIGIPPQSAPLIDMAPGLSITAGVLIIAGVPVATAMRGLFSAIFLFGWIGWGALALPIIRRSIRWNSRRLPVNSLLLTIAPVFFSVFYPSSDLFLWASMPYVLMLMAWPGNRILPFFLAGSFTAVSYLFRFASTVYAPAICLWMLIRFFSGERVLKPILSFLLGFALFASPEFLYLFSCGSVPHNISPHSVHVDFLQLIRDCSLSFVACTGMVGLGELISSLRVHSSSAHFLFGLGTIFFWISLPLMAWYHFSSWEPTERRRLVFLACLPIVHTGFLFAVQTIIKIDWEYLGNSRYYWSVGLAFPLLMYGFATNRERSLFVKAIRLFLFLYLAYFIVIRGTNRFDGGMRQLVNPMKVISGSSIPPASFPVPGFSSGFERSARLVKTYLDKNPGTIAFVRQKPAFDADGDDRIRKLPADRYWSTVTCGTATRIIIAGPPMKGGPLDILDDAKSKRGMEHLKKIPELIVLAEIPEEEMRILVGNIPAGYSAKNIQPEKK